LHLGHAKVTAFVQATRASSSYCQRGTQKEPGIHLGGSFVPSSFLWTLTILQTSTSLPFCFSLWQTFLVSAANDKLTVKASKVINSVFIS
jgi:hypothetical protein